MKPRTTAIALALFGALGFAPPAPARIVADIVSVGYSTRSLSSGGRRVIRLGVWTPVIVELSLEGQTRFDGRLRLGQRDRDGDVCYDEREVHLLGEAGPPQRFTLYALPQPGPNGAIDLSVELLDLDEERLMEVISAGQLVRALQPNEPIETITDDELLILEISEGQMGRIAALLDPERNVKTARTLNIAHSTPGALPDRWQGLEAVDCIVWDDADPDALSEAQRTALADWTRHGGTLLVAGARRMPALAKSDVFGPMLPVEVGELVSFRTAPSLRSGLLNIIPAENAIDPGYARPVPAVRCRLRSGPGIRRVFPPAGETDTDAKLDTLIARRRVDRGWLIFVAAPLNELLDPAGNAAQFFQKVLELRGGTSTEQSYGREARLDEPLERHIGFDVLAGVYMLFAMLFVSGYIALATFGSWSFLRSRGWDKHNWSVFALAAGAAVAISTIAVQALLGVGTDLHQVTVVDGTAGRPAATAIAYFGVKTGTHTTLDFWLPENYAQRTAPAPTQCSLRPLPSSRMPGESDQTYADPGSYGLRPATAELARVPVRATLKQLEGRWSGELRGTVRASVRITQRQVETGETEDDGVKKTVQEPCFDDASTLTNLLGVDLADAYLFQTKANTYHEERLFDLSPRAKDEIAVHRLGSIKDQETVNLAARIYIDPASGAADRDGRDGWYHSLLYFQNGWGSFADRSLTGTQNAARVNLETFMNALLLTTALSEYDPVDSTIKDPFGGAVVTFTRDKCRGLDLSDLLTTDALLLVGFAPTPGPVSLCARSRVGGDYKRIEPSEAWTMYRILIPVGTP